MSDSRLYKAMVQYKNTHAGDLFAREEIAELASLHLRSTKSSHPAVLDIGIGDSSDLLQIRKITNSEELALYGVEFDPRRIANAKKNGINVFTANIERDPLPLESGSLDVVMANHVIEHLKEIFFFFSEISRVLAPGGIAIIGFPNLGSWHNRLALLFGAQPPCMRVLGSHVRGYTIPGFKEFIQQGGFFKVRQVKGRAFYLAPNMVNKWLAESFPGLAAGAHFVLERTERPGTFIQVLDMNVPGLGDTPYFRGAAI